MLSTQEIAEYEQAGWIRPDLTLPAATVERLRDALERVLAANPGKRPENLMNVHMADSPEGVRGDQAFLDLATNADIVERVADLIGSDLILWGCALFCKPAGTGLEVPWHQDGRYWPIRPLATCTVWVALDQCGPDNACMRVIPGSHHGGLRAHHPDDDAGLALNQALDEGTFDPGEAADVVLAPGQMSMHDVNLIHGSNPNTSGRRRAGVALRYMPATSVFERDLPTVEGAKGTSAPDFGARPIFLVHGRDVSGRNTNMVDLTAANVG